MSKLVVCPMCRETGLVTRVPNTGFVLNLLPSTTWETEVCPLCNSKQRIAKGLAAAFTLVCPEYGYNKQLGYILITDNDLAKVLKYCEAR